MIMNTIIRKVNAVTVHIISAYVYYGIAVFHHMPVDWPTSLSLFLPYPCNKASRAQGGGGPKVTRQVAGLRLSPPCLLPLPFLCGLCSPFKCCAFLRGGPPGPPPGTASKTHSPDIHPTTRMKTICPGGQVERTPQKRSDGVAQ